MAAVQPVSADTSANFDSSIEYKPDPSNLARRSISIFSRRGAETPEAKPTFIAQAEIAQMPDVPVRHLTERQKSWLGRRRSVCGSPSASKTSGTILHAVPQSKRISMTVLEEEMATAPNDEILSAISEHAPTLQPMHSASQPTSPVRQTAPILQTLPLHTLSIAQRTSSQRKREVRNRIGVWVDGIVRWDEDPRPKSFLLDATIEAQTGLTPLKHSLRKKGDPPVRPRLSVRIPNQTPATNRTISNVVQPSQQRHVIALPPVAFPLLPAINADRTSMSVMTLNEPSPTDSTVTSNVLFPAPPKAEDPKLKRISHSSSSCSSPAEEVGSVCSKRSSATSVEGYRTASESKNSPRRKPSIAGGRPVTPPDHLTSGAVPTSPTASVINKPLPPSPILEADERFETSSVPPIPKKASARRSRNATKSLRVSSNPHKIKPAGEMRKSMSMSRLDACDRAFMLSAPVGTEEQGPSPTLSQAEMDLQAQLSNMSSNESSKKRNSTGSRRKRSSVASIDGAAAAKPSSAAVSRATSVRSVRSVMVPPERAPTIPKRSRRRDWTDSKSSEDLENLAATQQPPARRKTESEARSAERAADARAFRRTASMALIKHSAVRSRASTIEAASAVPPTPPIPTIVLDDGLIVVNGPRVIRPGDERDDAVVSAVAAEEVLLHIMSALNTTSDLFSMAVINRGMYRVFKDNEMSLIRKVSYNESAPAWEFREWSPPDINEPKKSDVTVCLDHTPETWMRCHARDFAVINGLKKLILARCATTIRKESAAAMADDAHPMAARINDAFWRIWCFCKIFGFEKNREEDVTGQLDWLKGGILANNQGCAATVNTNLEFEWGSVLLNAPDHFAKGNPEGLSAAQLFDMTEMWTCLTALLQAYLERTKLAREHGIFARVKIEGSDNEKLKEEESLLEKWTYHLLTLGPAVVLEMAELAADDKSIEVGFSRARENGWTKWSPASLGVSRSSFLKEPVARLYTEKDAAEKQTRLDPRTIERKEASRKRVAQLGKEIQLRRNLSFYKRQPLIDMSNERPMSMMSRNGSAASRGAESVRAPSIRSPSIMEEEEPAASRADSASLVSRLSPRPNSPKSNVSSPRKISPIAEESTEGFNNQRPTSDVYPEDTTARAIARVMQRGFTEAQAKEALCRTDLGDGLRVAAAIDMLVRHRRH